jgi:hypothetical protein
MWDSAMITKDNNRLLAHLKSCIVNSQGEINKKKVETKKNYVEDPAQKKISFLRILAVFDAL